MKEGEAEEGAEKKTNERRMIKGRGRAGDEKRVYRGKREREGGMRGDSGGVERERARSIKHA